MGSRIHLVSVLSAMLLGVVGAAVLGLMSPGARTGGTPLTPAQLAMVEKVAHDAVASSIPGPSGYPLVGPSKPAVAVGQWPANVSRVRYVATTREDAAPLTESEQPGQTQPVIVIRVWGSFSVVHSSPCCDPAAGVTHGHVMTVVVDASTGQVTDFGIDDAQHQPLPPQSRTLFQR